MKILKFTVLIIVAVAVLFFAMACLLPSVTNVEREITIHAPVKEAYKVFSKLSYWNEPALLQNEEQFKFFPDTLIQFSFLNKDTRKIIYAKIKLVQNNDSTITATLTQEMPLPLAFRYMSGKIEETTAPFMEEGLLSVKTFLELKNK
jgi:hypothetical protein